MADIERIRTRVVLREDRVENTASTAYPGAYPGVDDAWNFETFKKTFRIEVITNEGMEMEFDFVGADAAIANTFRRIMIAEVPTMAVEKCMIYNNTSLIPDETLAHRLGLVPLNADPRRFDFRASDVATERDTVVFNLQVDCKRNPKAAKDAPEDERYIDANVYSRHFEWVPQGDQSEQFPGGIRPVHEDILLAKLRPGQEISIELHCVKGIGKDHAKFSPVATASYRLLPEIILTKPVLGPDAHLLQSCFSPGVIEVVRNSKGVEEARVVNARADTMSREVFRHKHLAEAVQLQRVRDHFIFSIESTGALSAADIFREAIATLVSKCDALLSELQATAEAMRE